MLHQFSRKQNPLGKTNYKLVSVLLPVSKMQKQSPYLCEYGMVRSMPLSSLIGRWKKILDEKGFGGAVLMDLSKAFDTLNHELLIVKLSAYDFSN